MTRRFADGKKHVSTHRASTLVRGRRFLWDGKSTMAEPGGEVIFRVPDKGGTAELTIALERVYAAHSSKVLTRSSPGAFSLTSNSLIGFACIHLRSHAVVIAWKATSFGCMC